MSTINPDRWRVLSPYLDEALEIGAEERAAWLAAIAARDWRLAADLHNMLVQQRLVHESHFLECGVVAPRTTPASPEQSDGCTSLRPSQRAESKPA
jgi:hypothetical protein